MKTLFLIVLAAALQACGGGSDQPFAPFDIPTQRISASWRIQDVQQTYVIRTAPEWRAAWETHEPATIPRTAQPLVDFGNNMVVGLTLGAGPNGCHSVRISRVVEEADSIRVEYQRFPGPTSLPVACTLAIVPLTDFVAIKRSDKPVAFVATGVSHRP